MSPRSREAVRLTIAFSGRVSGALLSIFIVRIVGVGEAANPLYLALGVYTVANSLLLALLETNTVALWANKRAQRNGDLMSAGAVFGCLVGLAAVSFTVLLSLPVASMRPANALVAILALSTPLTGFYAVFLGLSVTRRSWVTPACGAWARVVVAGVLAVVLVPSLGFAGAAVAIVVGDLVRLSPMIWSRIDVWSRAARPSRALLRHAAVQVPSSLAGTANPLTDRVIVSQLALGSLGVLDLAEKTYGLASLAFTQGLLPSLFQRWAGHADRQRRATVVRRHAMLALPAGAVLSVVVAAVVLTLGPVVVGPALDGHVDVFRQASCAYMLGLPAYLATQVLVRLVILEGRGRLLNETAVVQLVVNLLTDLWFGAMWGIVGIAIATSAVTWVGLFLVWWVSRPLAREVPSHAEVESHV